MIYHFLELLSSFVIHTIASLGYLGIFLFMLLESAAIPIPSEIIMPFSGFLVFRGELEILWVVLWGAIGNLVGSIILYGIGYHGGRKLLAKYGGWVLISYHDLEIADRLFSRYGQVIIFVSRMLPVVRTYISFPAGVARMNFKKFCLYTFAGAVPWAIVLTQIGVVLGENWKHIEVYFRKFDFLIAVLGIISFMWWVRRHVRLRSMESQVKI